MDMNATVMTDNIPVEISVRIGRRRMTVAELSALQENDILPLDQTVDDGVEICVGEHVVARGELIADETDGDRLLLRIVQAGDGEE
ncbi:FliM/FliN family flagellar motor C-terminal domain-containing protein [Paracoccus sediminicola]|uniref:FliM/FliN family flagellar motor C-terminal domain-containing protein n=1 Tax=Paracoccus sediminicola TaxID=3017783 RepID=UPI0022F08040|nr:FliM/FliN family flagellar motor C-terminal domain-containing protein [Paracoccus sediminicola]WBU56723.1 FliM/FliN family flagellar motor C-terminal domain-containing protein [Paracoccus sediminicola]